MRNLVESILTKDFTKANDHLHEELKTIVARKLNEAKKMYAAKMSVGEQLNVDKRGNYDETGGRKVILSHEKQKRGLAEGDVVPFTTKNDNDTLDLGTHTLRLHKDPDKGAILTHKESGKQTELSPDAMAAARRHLDKNPDDHSGAMKILSQKYGITTSKDPNYPRKPKSADIETMKEEAKKAALSIVAKREETSEEKVNRFRKALEGPGRLTSKKPKLVVKKND